MEQESARILHDILLRRIQKETGIPIDQIPRKTVSNLLRILFSVETDRSKVVSPIRSEFGPDYFGDSFYRPYVRCNPHPPQELFQETDREISVYLGPVFLTSNLEAWQKSIIDPFSREGAPYFLYKDTAIVEMMKRIGSTDESAIAELLETDTEGSEHLDLRKYGHPFSAIAVVETREIKDKKIKITQRPLWIIPDITSREMAYLREYEESNTLKETI